MSNSENIQASDIRSAKNRASKGPSYLNAPFYPLSHKFWPDREEFRKEAEAIYGTERERETHEIANPEGVVTVLDFQFSHDDTPVLNRYRDAFIECYGDTFGRISAHYFYLDGDGTYEWHRDNILPPSTLYETDNGKKLPVNCCVNVVVSDEGSQCEFLDHGRFNYTAGVLNTSHVHRVHLEGNRILARLSFSHSIYEEVVHRIRKVDKKNNRSSNV